MINGSVTIIYDRFTFVLCVWGVRDLQTIGMGCHVRPPLECLILK